MVATYAPYKTVAVREKKTTADFQLSVRMWESYVTSFVHVDVKRCLHAVFPLSLKLLLSYVSLVVLYAVSFMLIAFVLSNVTFFFQTNASNAVSALEKVGRTFSVLMTSLLPEFPPAPTSFG